MMFGAVVTMALAYFATMAEAGSKLAKKEVTHGFPHDFQPEPPDISASNTPTSPDSGNTIPMENSPTDTKDYWLIWYADLGKQPLAKSSNYSVYRDVTTYGASPNGDVDASDAINAAIQDGNRCGLGCTNSFTTGAIIYFPPGTYKICKPIIQLYYTQFIGNPLNPPILKGCANFAGAALIDTDPYIPHQTASGGSGSSWYITRNQFFRQIRNFIFDMTDMPSSILSNGVSWVPTGLHWQVSQACSLQNLVFRMPQQSPNNTVTHIGIFSEDSSSGFVSDLEFHGGNIGWKVGSEQYTARGLKFRNCTTSIEMIWDWGFNWQDIDIEGGHIGLDIRNKDGGSGQGIGSVSLVDSSISSVAVGISTASSSGSPNIIVENTLFKAVESPIASDNGTLLLSESQFVSLWATGPRYHGGTGDFQTGFITETPYIPAVLLDDNGKLYTRSRPQYQDFGVPMETVLVATLYACTNDGTGDNTEAINSFLVLAAKNSRIAYFPAGIYTVYGTINVPNNSRIVGSSWSQIQATGPYFENMTNPQVFVKAGVKGDVGVLEISDMIFTVKGPTAGVIMVEWNIKAQSPGSAGMWDTHIRVGGALGSELDHSNCPELSPVSTKCIAASLLLHVTSNSSGYFENVWMWVADHDNDMNMYNSSDKLAFQTSVYSSRGILIESQGPCWFYATASEHNALYQYQLHNARNIYLGHLRTETPYFQPQPAAPTPFEKSVALSQFSADPSFSDCQTDSCRQAWGVRIIDSEDVIIHGAGMYTWYSNYNQDCLGLESCQERIMEVSGSSNITVFNIFTKGVSLVATGNNNRTNIPQGRSNQLGYTTEVSLWIPEDGGDNIIYVGANVSTSRTVHCTPPCTLVLPPISLPSNTTIPISPYPVSLEVGSMVGSSFVLTTITTTVTVKWITTDKIHQSNVIIMDNSTRGAFTPYPSVPIPPATVQVTNGYGQVTPRTIILPPWPSINEPPGAPLNSSSMTEQDWDGIGDPYPVTAYSATGPTVVVVSQPSIPVSIVPCSPVTFSFPSPATSLILPNCTGSATVSWDCPLSTTITLEQGSTLDSTVSCTPLAAVTGTTDSIWPKITTWSEPLYTTPPVVMNCPPNTRYIQEHDAVITLLDCTGETTLMWDCPPSKTVSVIGSTDISFSLGCTVFTGIGYPLPVWTTWPAGQLIWTNDNSEQNKKTHCDLWFFSICINWPELNITITGWIWDFPFGIFPPLPPPYIIWPPGISVDPVLPGPWPVVTLGTDGKPTYPTEKPSECTTKTAEVCATSTILSTTGGSNTSSTSTTSQSTCTTISGCAVEGDDTTTTTTTGSGSSCPYLPFAATATSALSRPEAETRSQQVNDDDKNPCRPQDVIIYIDKPENGAFELEEYLEETPVDPNNAYGETWMERTNIVGIKLVNWVAFLFVRDMDDNLFQYLQARSGAIQGWNIDDIYKIQEWNENRYPGRERDRDYLYLNRSARYPVIMSNATLHHADLEALALPMKHASTNLTLENMSSDNLSVQARTMTWSAPFWGLSLMSVPPKGQWSDYYWRDKWGDLMFDYHAEDTYGEGQTIFIIEDGLEIRQDDEELGQSFDSPAGQVERDEIEYLPDAGFPEKNRGKPNLKHGNQVTSKAYGALLGLAKKASIVIALNYNKDPPNKNDYIHERYLASLVAVLGRIMEDLQAGKREYGNPKAIVNMSFGWLRRDALYMRDAHWRLLFRVLQELDKRSVVLVAASHNEYLTADDYRVAGGLQGLDEGWPSMWANPQLPDEQALRNLIIVSGIDQNSQISPINPYADWLAMAPGYDDVAYDADPPEYVRAAGASLAAPLVAGTIAYWRGLANLGSTRAIELEEPENVKKLVQFMHRSLQYNDFPTGGPRRQQKGARVPFLWTGNVPDGNCLVDSSLKGCPRSLTDQSSIENLPPRGADCGGVIGSESLEENDDQFMTCPLVLTPAAKPTGGPLVPGGDPITFASGDPGPTCVSDCGSLCSGYYCIPTPTGDPPNYGDPADPSSHSHYPHPTSSPTTPVSPAPKTTTIIWTSTTTTASISTATARATPISPFSVIYPLQSGMNCLTQVDITNITACYHELNTFLDPLKTYYTNDSSVCVDQGSIDDGPEDMPISSYCVVMASNQTGCSLVYGWLPPRVPDNDTAVGGGKFTGVAAAAFVDEAYFVCGSQYQLAAAVSRPLDNGTFSFTSSFCLVHTGQESACGAYDYGADGDLWFNSTGTGG